MFEQKLTVGSQQILIELKWILTECSSGQFVSHHPISHASFYVYVLFAPPFLFCSPLSFFPIFYLFTLMNLYIFFPMTLVFACYPKGLVKMSVDKLHVGKL